MVSLEAQFQFYVKLLLDALLAVGHFQRHANAEVYMINDQAWRQIEAYPFHDKIAKAPILHHADNFYHFGGDIGPPSQITNTVARLDATFKWHSVGALGRARRSHSAIVSGDFFLIVGGHGSTAGPAQLPTEKCILDNDGFICTEQTPYLEAYQQYAELFTVPDDFCKYI